VETDLGTLCSHARSNAANLPLARRAGVYPLVLVDEALFSSAIRMPTSATAFHRHQHRSE
jgi:hypothetical protein